MTTIAVAKKAGRIAIAGDTLTKWGSGKESATYIVNHEKTLKIGDTHLAITGSATFKLILADYFARAGAQARFDNVADIFKTWNKLHAALKEYYFIRPDEADDDPLESSRVDVLIANPHGIFGVAAHRSVQEYAKFYAFGSGTEYALGAMYAAYEDPAKSADDLVRLAVTAAAEFDDETGLPLTVHSFAAIEKSGG